MGLLNLDLAALTYDIAVQHCSTPLQWSATLALQSTLLHHNTQPNTLENFLVPLRFFWSQRLGLLNLIQFASPTYIPYSLPIPHSLHRWKSTFLQVQILTQRLQRLQQRRLQQQRHLRPTIRPTMRPTMRPTICPQRLQPQLQPHLQRQRKTNLQPIAMRPQVQPQL